MFPPSTWFYLSDLTLLSQCPSWLSGSYHLGPVPTSWQRTYLVALCKFRSITKRIGCTYHWLGVLNRRPCGLYLVIIHDWVKSMIFRHMKIAWSLPLVTFGSPCLLSSRRIERSIAINISGKLSAIVVLWWHY